MLDNFVTLTAVERIDESTYQADIDERFNLRPLPQGGVVTAFALRAMAQSLDDPSARLRTLHTTFIGQVSHGPVDIDVEVLRRGRSMSHLRAEVRNSGRERGHITTAVFGVARDGFDFVDLRPPVVPLPADCPSFRDQPPPGVPAFAPTRFWDEMVEGRVAIGRQFWEHDGTVRRAERAMWQRFDEAPYLDDGTIDPLSLVVLSDTMPGAIHERIKDDRMWFAPSIDLTVHLLGVCRSPWVLCHNTVRQAGDGYASADLAMYDCGEDCTDEPRLVAYGTQLFVFSFNEG